ETSWETLSEFYLHFHREAFLYSNGMRFFDSPLSLLQSKVKGGALAGLRIGPNPAAVFLHDALHRSQSHASALKVFGIVQSHEDSKELARESWIKSDSVIAHE